MYLVAEALDKQLKDRHGTNAGRVDGIVLELRDGEPPSVVAIEVGPITLLSRFSTGLAAWYARHDARIHPDRGKPFRLSWSLLTMEGPAISGDFDVDSTPIDRFEDWLRRVVVDHLPLT